MTQETYKYGIVGFGISGQLLVLELLQGQVSPNDIILFDKDFMGGELSTQYGSVLSNTPWWKTKKALDQYPQWSESILKGFGCSDEQCTPVRVIAKACFETASTAAKPITKLTTNVQSLQYDSNMWSIIHSYGTIKAHTLFLCVGGTPKKLSIDLPQIPLHIALDKEQLKHHITQNDSICVFGTAHSGTIILEHLADFKVPITGIYSGPTPFKFADEGAYDGLKEATAITARKILQGEFPFITLVPWSDPLVVHKALQKATKVIIATGFSAKSSFGAEFLQYNSDTAEIMPNCYGFGMAYPGITVIAEKKYVDVSVLSFQEQIQRCLSSILTTNN